MMDTTAVQQLQLRESPTIDQNHASATTQAMYNSAHLYALNQHIKKCSIYLIDFTVKRIVSPVYDKVKYNAFDEHVDTNGKTD